MTDTLFADFATDTIQSLQTRLENTPAPSPDDLRYFSDGMMVVATFVTEMWTQEKRKLDRGIAGHIFMRSVKSFERVIEKTTVIFGVLEEAAEAVEDSNEARDARESARAKVELIEAELKRFRVQLSSVYSPEEKAKLRATVGQLTSDPSREYVSDDDLFASPTESN